MHDRRIHYINTSEFPETSQPLADCQSLTLAGSQGDFLYLLHMLIRHQVIFGITPSDYACMVGIVRKDQAPSACEAEELSPANLQQFDCILSKIGLQDVRRPLRLLGQAADTQAECCNFYFILRLLAVLHALGQKMTLVFSPLHASLLSCFTVFNDPHLQMIREEPLPGIKSMLNLSKNEHFPHVNFTSLSRILWEVFWPNVTLIDAERSGPSDVYCFSNGCVGFEILRSLCDGYAVPYRVDTPDHCLDTITGLNKAFRKLIMEQVRALMNAQHASQADASCCSNASKWHASGASSGNPIYQLLHSADDRKPVSVDVSRLCDTTWVDQLGINAPFGRRVSLATRNKHQAACLLVNRFDIADKSTVKIAPALLRSHEKAKVYVAWYCTSELHAILMDSDATVSGTLKSAVADFLTALDAVGARKYGILASQACSDAYSACSGVWDRFKERWTEWLQALSDRNVILSQLMAQVYGVLDDLLLSAQSDEAAWLLWCEQCLQQPLTALLAVIAQMLRAKQGSVKAICDKAKDAFDKPPTVYMMPILLHERFPGLLSRFPKSSTHIPVNPNGIVILPDLQGNFLLLLHALIKHNMLVCTQGQFTGLTAGFHKRAPGVSGCLGSDSMLSQQAIQRFIDTVDEVIRASAKPLARLCSIGDGLGDRCGNDFWMIWLLTELHRLAFMPIGILLSNHEVNTLSYFLNSPNISHLRQDQARSLFQLDALIRANTHPDASYPSLRQRVIDHYLPMLRLCMVHVVQPPNKKLAVVLLTHAHVGYETLDALCRQFDLTFDPWTSEGLIRSLDALNQAFTKRVFERLAAGHPDPVGVASEMSARHQACGQLTPHVPPAFPLYRLAWHRADQDSVDLPEASQVITDLTKWSKVCRDRGDDVPETLDGFNVVFGHGHDGNLVYSDSVNLDTQAEGIRRGNVYVAAVETNHDCVPPALLGEFSMFSAIKHQRAQSLGSRGLRHFTKPVKRCHSDTGLFEDGNQFDDLTGRALQRSMSEPTPERWEDRYRFVPVTS